MLDTRTVPAIQNISIEWFFSFPNNSLCSSLTVNRCSPDHSYYGSSPHSLGVLVGRSVPPFQAVQGWVFVAILAPSHPVPYNSSANGLVIVQNLVSEADVANSFVGGCQLLFQFTVVAKSVFSTRDFNNLCIWFKICRFAESIFYGLGVRSLADLSWSLWHDNYTWSRVESVNHLGYVV